MEATLIILAVTTLVMAVTVSGIVWVLYTDREEARYERRMKPTAAPAAAKTKTPEPTVDTLPVRWVPDVEPVILPFRATTTTNGSGNRA